MKTHIQKGRLKAEFELKTQVGKSRRFLRQGVKQLEKYFRKVNLLVVTELGPGGMASQGVHWKVIAVI